MCEHPIHPPPYEIPQRSRSRIPVPPRRPLVGFPVADSNPLNNNHTRADTPSTSSTDSPEVAAAKRKVADLQIKLLMFQDHLADLQTQEPKDPGPNASAGDRKKYKTAHSAWQQNVDKIQHQIDYVKQQLAIAQKELQAAEAAARGGH